MALALLIVASDFPRCHRNILRPGVKNLSMGKSMVKHVVSESIRFGSHEPLDFIKKQSEDAPCSQKPNLQNHEVTGNCRPLQLVTSKSPKSPSPQSMLTAQTTAGLLCQLPASVQLPRILWKACHFHMSPP